MNDPDKLMDQSESDALLDSLLAPLKQLEPSLDGRLRNRLAIANALQEAQSAAVKEPRPWWRATVSIPVPIAAALALAAGLALIASYHSGQQYSSAHPAQVLDHASSPLAQNTSNPHDPAMISPVAYHGSEIYLCGVGRLQSESGYFLQEQIP